MSQSFLAKEKIMYGDDPLIAYEPDLLYIGDGHFIRGAALLCDPVSGYIAHIRRQPDSTYPIARPVNRVPLEGRAVLPGLVNGHSHAFQRVIRGRTELRSAARDSFWTWREMMYNATARLSPEDIYDASRMAFLEMILGGITAVGEFHYIHRTPRGALYDDPNLIAKEVVRAARSAGLRIALLRVAYARSGYRVPPDGRQARFIEPDAEVFLRHVVNLEGELKALDSSATESVPVAWAGVAPHSVRAVPLDYLREVVAFADERQLPVHMHLAEQPAEVSACRQEYGQTPVALLAGNNLLSPRFTAVHAIHITAEEARLLADARARVCACPTTERNLGDGIVPADILFKENVAVSLGTDSHAQIDILEDARELEYHLRLQRMERAVLAPSANSSPLSIGTTDEIDRTADLAALLFDCATVHGAESIGLSGGALAEGRPADFFTVDLTDPAIAGANTDDLLPAIVFTLGRAAVREVVVGGRMIVQHGQHPAQTEIVERFATLQQKLWGRRVEG